MTGDFCMEEILFLVKPELMVAMALQGRMPDTEAVCITGAVQYSLTSGYKTSLKFAGSAPWVAARSEGRLHRSRVCAIDAIRGGGLAMTETALLRDMNKARIAFEGAGEIATGHWGCGAFGNNHDLMFLKQWLAASEAGAETLHYHDFPRGGQSHSIAPLARKLRQMTVGELWSFLTGITAAVSTREFSTRMREVATGKVPLPIGISAVQLPASAPSAPRIQRSNMLEAAPQSRAAMDVKTQSHKEVSEFSQQSAACTETRPEAHDASTEASDSVLGKRVLYKGEEMTCVRQSAGQLRLQHLNGSFTWASHKDVQTLTVT